MAFALSTKWFSACCALVVLLLAASLLWNPVVDAADEVGAGSPAVAEACDSTDQSDRDSAPIAAADVHRRTRWTRSPDAITCGAVVAFAGPVLPPPERPPRS